MDEIKRIARELRCLVDQERAYQNILAICEDETERINNEPRQREEMINKWKNEYRRLAYELVRTSLADDNAAGRVDIEFEPDAPISQRIYRVDDELVRLSMLAAELNRYLLDDDQCSMMTAKDIIDTSTITDAGMDTEEVPVSVTEGRASSNYIRFVIVDEQGRPLGENREQAKQEQQQQRPTNRSGYEHLSGVSSDTDQGSIQTAAGYQANGWPQGVNRSHTGRAVRSTSPPSEIAPHSQWRLMTTTGAENTASPGSGKEDSNRIASEKWKGTPAYSVLTDDNKFILVPILKVMGKESGTIEAKVTTSMSDAQRLWQQELNSSSGRPIWYNLVGDLSTSGRQSWVVQTDGGGDQIDQTKNVQRSLLHRILDELPLRLSEQGGKEKSEENLQ